MKITNLNALLKKEMESDVEPGQGSSSGLGGLAKRLTLICLERNGCSDYGFYEDDN